jgi:hypothetical protein
MEVGDLASLARDHRIMEVGDLASLARDHRIMEVGDLASLARDHRTVEAGVVTVDMAIQVGMVIMMETTVP